MRGWRRLDHWGHLGGAAAGAAWAGLGGEKIWRASFKGAERLRSWVREEEEAGRMRKREREERERRRRRERPEREEQQQQRRR